MIEDCSSEITDIFSRVEIEINTACNKKEDLGSFCQYCPNSIIAPIDPPQLMDDDIYKKIIDELEELRFSGRLSFHFYGEPLIHPRIEWIIRYAAERLPAVERILYTNGDRLTDTRYYKLVESGVTQIAISNHSKKEFPPRPYQTVLENCHITNRGGLLGGICTLKLPCFAPQHRLVIAYNGDVLLCYEDAERINGFGNIKDKSIKEIWFSDTFNKIKQDLMEGRRNLYSPCKVCDNQAHTKYGQINVNNFKKENSKEIRKLLKPLHLHSLLEKSIKEAMIEEPVVSITQIASNTLKIASRIQIALMNIGKEFNIKAQTFEAKTGEHHEPFLSSITTYDNDFILLQVHGIETEERLLEAVTDRKMAGKLIVYIHRPEELLLRVALEENVSYSAAKVILAKKLERAKAIVLPGDCFIREYQDMLPQAIVAAIPLGFVEPEISVDISSRLTPEGAVCIGSNTTWGETRHINDLLELLKAVNRQDNDIRVFGYALGKFDRHNSIAQFINNPDFLFLSNEEILDAYRNDSLTNETTFREWLYRKADGRLIIRAKIENEKIIPHFFSKTDDSFYQWESVMIDFNVQLYHEILDEKRELKNRGLPKVEYSGTLHKGDTRIAFIVFDSMSMRDVQENEGLRMIQVPCTNGKADFDSAAGEIIGLLKDSAKRKEIIEKNAAVTKLLGMREIAFAFYNLMIFIRNMDNK